MFEILNGRSSFWQWDINQKLVVQDLQNGAEVHFSNGNSDYALVTLVKTVDGKKVCDVPNVVLQKSGYVNVFAYVIDGEEKYTEYKASILILARSKPEDYIYTETETICYKNLSEKIGDVSLLETDAKENLVDAVNEIAKKAASGADLSLGITGAAAGQIATVEAVDNQGKPTKWKHENIAGAVGFPAPTASDNGKYLGCENGAAVWKPVEASGGGAEQTSEWEIINSIEITEEGITAVTFDRDVNGNEFDLTDAFLVSNSHASLGGTSAGSLRSMFFVNGIKFKHSCGNLSNLSRRFSAIISAINGTLYAATSDFTSNTGIPANIALHPLVKNANDPIELANERTVKSIKIDLFSPGESYFAVGYIFTLYGRRKK